MAATRDYIGYIRVSTPRQGEGVSLEVQRDAISGYAERNHLPITLWLDEKETAGKRGRPVFNHAMKLLRQRKHRGIILHKLDRGARNLNDWADLGELVDQGIEVHFVTESLDLQTRGGRLSADIQAVVAADFVRNQREETRKGLYGRLKQGLYPWRAPLGYRDNGKGKVKTIDPVRGPLVRRAFELYGTGTFNYQTLGDELHRLGLQNYNGSRVTRNGLATILHNTFYCGVIQIKKVHQSFAGKHEPLIGKSLFDRVQAVLTGKFNARVQRHAFAFRRLFSCAVCGYALTGEYHKGHVYYRCHGEHFPRASIREDVIEQKILELIGPLKYEDEEKAYFSGRLLKLREDWKTKVDEETRSFKLTLDHIKDRRNRLTDAYLDQVVDKATFEERKTSLLFEEKTIEENLKILARGERGPAKIENFLELAGSALLSYQKGNPEERREIVKIVTSNRTVHEKTLYLEPSNPFALLVNRFKYTECEPERTTVRTWNRLLDILSKQNAVDELPDFSGGFVFRDQEENIKN